MNRLRDHDPARDVHADPATMAMVLDDIITTPRPERRRRRWRAVTLVALTATLLALAIVLQPGTGAPPILGPAKALAFARNGDHIDVRIVDPDADPARYQKDFAAHGLNVSLVLVPTSPSLVGTVIDISSPTAGVHYSPDAFEIRGARGGEWITAIEGRDCGNTWCKAGVSIPLDLRSQVELVVGRPARPGERYETGGDPAARGEVMEGEDLTNLTVAELRLLARERDAVVEAYYELEPKGDRGNWVFSDRPLQPENIPEGWYVHAAWGGDYAGTVRVVVASWPSEQPLWDFLRSLMFWRD
ncbi:hypothetical protein [Herbidospora sp. RD11066]